MYVDINPASRLSIVVALLPREEGVFAEFLTNPLFSTGPSVRIAVDAHSRLRRPLGRPHIAGLHWDRETVAAADVGGKTGTPGPTPTPEKAGREAPCQSAQLPHRNQSDTTERLASTRQESVATPADGRHGRAKPLKAMESDG